MVPQLRAVFYFGVVVITGITSVVGARSGSAEPLSCLGVPVTIVAGDSGVVRGGGGRDTIYAVDDVRQTIYAGGGNDVICAGPGDTVYAGGGADSVQARESSAIYGESGSDGLSIASAALVNGGSGNDFLGVGEAKQVLGGGGNDRFLITHFVSLCDGGSGVDEFSFGGCETEINFP